MLNIINQIVKDDQQGELYFDIYNAKGKEWLIPRQGYKTGLSIYQPTAFKGRIFKKLFVVIVRSNFLMKILNVRSRSIRYVPGIACVLKEYFGSDYQTSLFGGTPCVHQKTVIQVYRKKRILAYCKIAVSEEIGKIFDLECENLSYLRRKGIENVPEVLFRENTGDFKLFCQSSVKGIGSQSPTKLTEVHYVFLEDLYNKTAIFEQFEKTDYASMLASLERNLIKLPMKDRDIIVKAIDEVRAHYAGKCVNFCFYHGDFTPWNMAVENGRLKAFDFEYAKKSYPKYLDMIHFFMQTEIFVKHNNEDRICDDFRKLQTKFLNEKEKRHYMMCYLLEIINLYLSRTDEEDQDEQKNTSLRKGVLERISRWN
ncbi:MAG: phosphotransferase [Clostridiales bacterium]|nr:phosphotransferase [Clostridiales bacterium]